MRCKTCDYSLWGIGGRTCPECGGAFKPSDFDLVASAVRFLCPHCRQQYFGTTAQGHLDPVEFDCVSCGAHIHMDEMVLEPREGIADHRTRANKNPWLDRPRLKLRQAYYRTIGQSIGGPARLARATPASSRVWTALGFYAVTAIWVSVLSVLPLAVLMAVMIPTGHRGAMQVIWPVVIVMMAPIVILMIVPLVWGLLTQILLVFVGGKPTQLGTTYKALAYSSGPMLLCAIPCLGAHASMIAVPWWMANAIVMLTAMHRIAWWRATIAHVLGGAIALAIPIGGIWAWSAYLYVQPFSGPALSPASIAGLGLSSVLQQKRTPGKHEHLINLLTSQPHLGVHFDDLARATIAPPEIMVGPATLDEFLASPGPDAAAIRAELSAAMAPSGVHRLGHIVVCDVGVDVFAPQGPDLWIAIIWPDPDSGAVFTQPETVVVVLASGMAQDIPLAQFPADLAAQNAARAALGIPEIPDPATVRMWPAVSVYAPSPQPVPAPAPVP